MALNSGKILMRRGQEVNFDPNKMTPGEWAVSLDSKYVRMCFSPGVCVRMATYDAFEADMVQIQRILEECQTIEETVNRINDEISVKAQAVAEYTAQAKQYRDEAEQFRNEAFSSTPEGYFDLVEQVGENTRKIAEGVGGVSSYNDLENKPKINDVVLEGEKTLEELGIASKEALEKTDSKVNIIIESAELRFKENASGENIHLDDSADSKLVEFGLYGKSKQNGEPTPESPIDIEVSGESYNLLPYPYVDTTKEVNGITFIDNKDGTITANGTVTATTDFNFYRDTTFKKGKYIFSKGNNDTVAVLNVNRYKDGAYHSTILANGNAEAQFELTEDDVTNYTIRIYIRYSADKVVENLIFKPMIRKASVKNDRYMPYGVGSVEVKSENEDGTKSKTATIPTKNGLAGIPIDSGGNYTDSNGQQWICDEVVKYADGSGEKIQRVGIIDSYSAETITGVYMSTTGELTEGAKILYQLAKPITTSLTAEELAEIEKLSTFYPVTNISNDFDCGMKVKYIADAKRYVDNRIALIEQAMLNSI